MNCPQEEAEDIFVESIINFREKIINNKISYLNSTRNYLYTTCKNMWLVRIQKKAAIQKKSEMVSDYLYDEYEEDPFTKIANLEEEEHLEQCQDILHYYYVENFSSQDIVEVLGISNKGVLKVMKFRCLKKLTSIATKNLKTS